MGFHKLSQGGKRYKVLKEISHPSYSTTPLVYNDLGLLELEEAVHFTQEVYPACLSVSDRFTYSNDLMVAGWGVIEESSRKLTDVPMKASLSQTNFFRCYYDWFGLLSYTSHICGFQKSQSACFGDSGGALLSPLEDRKAEVVGIVSFGSNCHSTKPTVFTKVSSYHDWIKSQVGDVCVNKKRIEPIDEVKVLTEDSSEDPSELVTIESEFE